ncbi:LysR family transcriptional regulator [Companilactobacillus paralimentarius]|uniref:LysR family transcriptional regulator n=1 Tax=Companilactobacillus paralimentarius TaxID=83526 RepID=UPI0028530E06|nr:LysR family transcriptional regulator [Companilactobacillus paralimentarius]MDR4932558.1 LysR family transcriptional regulator [Companilactobacillus paralimentarius]
MDIRELTTFKMISETRNFSKAAELLGYTQSNISMQIKNLEAELGTKLFECQKRQVIITQTGIELLPLVTKTLENFSEIKTWNQEVEQTGILKIAAPESLTISMVAPMLKRFKQKYPQVQIELQNATCLHNEETLLRGEVDVAFMMWPSRPSKKLIDHDLGEQEMVLVVPTDSKVSFQKLLNDRNTQFIINEPECSYRNQFETAVWQQHQRQFRTTSLDGIAAIKAAVVNELGFSYLPLTMVENEIKNQKLRIVKTDIVNHVHAHLLTRDYKEKSNLISEFIKMF